MATSVPSSPLQPHFKVIRILSQTMKHSSSLLCTDFLGHSFSLIVHPSACPSPLYPPRPAPPAPAPLPLPFNFILSDRKSSERRARAVGASNLIGRFVVILLVEAFLLEGRSVVIIAWANLIAGHHPGSLGLRLEHRVLVLVRLVPLGQHLVLVGAAVGPLVLYRGLERVPVDVDHLLLLGVGRLVLETLLLAVEGSLLDVDLLQVLYVLLYPQGPLAHVVAVHVVEGDLLVVLQELEAVLGRVECVLHSPLELLLAPVVQFVLSRPWDRSLLLLEGLVFEPLGLCEVAQLGCAPFLQRIELIPIALQLPYALLPYLFLVVLLKSGHLLQLYLALPEDLLPRLPDLLLHVAAVLCVQLVVARTWVGVLLSIVLLRDH